MNEYLVLENSPLDIVLVLFKCLMLVAFLDGFILKLAINPRGILYSDRPSILYLKLYVLITRSVVKTTAPF